jgi:hypothetical protein
MRHFNYFENGGPYPGTCLSCGATKELFDVGGTRLEGGSNLLCKKCSVELALFLGYVEEAPLQEQMNNLEADIEAHERELARIPDHVEDLINGIRSRVTDFVFAVSYGDSVSSAEDAEKPKLSSVPTDQHSTTAKRGSVTPIKPASK